MEAVRQITNPRGSNGETSPLLEIKKQFPNEDIVALHAPLWAAIWM